MNVRNYVVTGANGEIGTALCRRLVRDGHRVIAITRRSHKFEFEHPEELLPNLVVADLADQSTVSRLFTNIRQDFGPINGLVYGAAIFNRFNSLADMDVNSWIEILKVNTVAAFVWNTAFIDLCRDNESAGSIVNISSQAGFTGGYGGVIPYASSKGAMITMTKGLAREVASARIRVNCVAPGFIETGAMKGNLSNDQLETFYSRVPMRRFGQVDEVASLINFLLSPESSYITGATYDVSGGQLMH